MVQKCGKVTLRVNEKLKSGYLKMHSWISVLLVG